MVGEAVDQSLSGLDKADLQSIVFFIFGHPGVLSSNNQNNLGSVLFLLLITMLRA